MDQEKYIKGFNAGYSLAKERPALAQILSRGTQSREDDYAKAMLAGIAQYEKDRQEDRIKDFKDKQRQQDRPNDRGYDLDR